ncbi:MAG: TIGR01458 family HAD-type hydrolase [Thioalkalispiraceae bacterium]|jgi:HAD superfamily hydrolase (TIGR01458 family)
MQAILFDLDGVFYIGDQLIDGSLDALHWCNENHIPYLFITNTTSKPPQAIVKKLLALGIETGVSRILSPPVATVDWLKQQGIQRISLYIGEQTRSMFSEFQLVNEPDEPSEAVIVGDMGEGWSFQVMNRAFRQLMQTPPPVMIALGMTRYWRAPDGLRLDAGAYVSALQYASGIEPVVLGKPAQAFFDAATQRLAVNPSEVLMIGDDIKGDIDGAQQAGIHGLLVRTGKFRPSDLDSQIQPYAVIDSIADLPSWWLLRQKSS